MNDFIAKQLVGGMPDLERRLQWWSDQFKFRISQSVGRLRAGKITLAEFQQFGRDELRDTYYGIAETGLGRRLTRKEMYQIRTVIKEQRGFWDRFCQAIADQRQALLDEGLEGAELEAAFNNLYDKFDRRAQSYAGAIEAEGTRWAMARLYKDGQWFQWKLRPAEHCATCLEREDTIAQMKDGRLPYYPKDGTTLCLYNCLCYWQPISRFKALALRALGKLKRVFRRKSFEEVAREELERLEKGGPGSGWFAPPKGTHVAGAKAGLRKPKVGRAGKAPVGPDTTTKAANAFLNKGLFPERMVGVGLTAETTIWKGAPDKVRMQAKDEIVTELSERTGIDYEEVNKFVEQWAHSSNDDDMRSLAVQRDAAKEFDIELSNFTKGKIATLKQDREANIEHEMKIMEQSREWAESSIDEAFPRYRPIMDSINQRKILRAMYDNTREKLAEAGFKEGDTIRLYRGVKLPGTIADWESGSIQRIKGNALESWTLGEDVARYFAGGMTEREVGLVFEMDVPIESIIATARTGFGCLNEGEFVILGSLESRARIAEVR